MVGLHQPAFVSARRQRLFYPLSENTARQPAYSETVVQSYNAGVKNQLARLGTAALELVFPSRCVGCGEYGSFCARRASLPCRALSTLLQELRGAESRCCAL